MMYHMKWRLLWVDLLGMELICVSVISNQTINDKNKPLCKLLGQNFKICIEQNYEFKIIYVILLLWVLSP